MFPFLPWLQLSFQLRGRSFRDIKFVTYELMYHVLEELKYKRFLLSMLILLIWLIHINFQLVPCTIVSTVPLIHLFPLHTFSTP